MRLRVLSAFLGVFSFACSGEDAGPPGTAVGATKGGGAGALGSGELVVGGAAGRVSGGAGGASAAGQAGSPGGRGGAGAGQAGGGQGGSGQGGGGQGGSGQGGAGQGGSGQGGASAGQGGAAAGQGGGAPSIAARSHTLAVGDTSACALGPSGIVKCWGYDTGIPAVDHHEVIALPSPLEGASPVPAFVSVASAIHSCGLTEAGAVHCWGNGAPTPALGGENPFPAALALSPADEVAVANETTCVRIGGQVSCFGQADLGGTGATTGLQGLTPVPGIGDAGALASSAFLFCALRPGLVVGRRVSCWGKGLPGVVDVPEATDVEQIAVSGAGWILLRSSGGALFASKVAGSTVGIPEAVPVGPVDTLAADSALCVVRTADKVVLCKDLGKGSPSDGAVPFVEISGFAPADPAAELATGTTRFDYQVSTSCARTVAGNVLCWGADRYGQLGTGLSEWALEPAVVPGVEQASRVAVGEEGTVALVDGKAVTWGALNAYGFLVERGDFAPTPQPVASTEAALQDFQIGAYDDLAYGVRQDGTLYASDPTPGESLLGHPSAKTFLPGPIRRPTYDLGVATTASGTALAFYSASPNDAAMGATGIFANGGKPAGAKYTLVALPNLVGFSSGTFHGLAWDKVGKLYCWGQNDQPRCGETGGANVVAPTPLVLPGGEKVVSACGGWDTTCAVTATGKVYCVGQALLGIGGSEAAPGAPHLKAVGDAMTGIACARYSVCAWSPKMVQCWGDNAFGALGVGDLDPRKEPTTIKHGGALHVSVGGEHACAVGVDGSVSCWGSPWSGRLGNGKVGFRPTQAVAVALQ